MDIKDYRQIYNFAKQTFRDYKGEVIVEENCVKLVDKHLVEGKNVECVVKIGVQDDPFCDYPFFVDATEKTYQILGGTGSPCVNMEEIEKETFKQLERYGFKKRENNGQMNMFDLIEKEEIPKMEFDVIQRQEHHLIMGKDYALDEIVFSVSGKDLNEARENALNRLKRGCYPRGKRDTGKDNWMEYKYMIKLKKEK